MSNSREIQFGALKIFAAVAQSETLTDAAQKLGITQSAVSQAIAQLEESTNVQLVVRRSRPIMLTPAGQVLNRHADKILASTRRMLKEVVSASRGELPKLTIGIVDSFCAVAGQHLIDKIAPIAPQLSIQTGINNSMSKALVNHDIDMLISSEQLEAQSDLERHPILRDPFIMLVPEKLKKENLDPESLSRDLPFIRYSSKTTRVGVLTDLVVRRLNITPETRYEFDNTHSLLSTVAAGKGWGMVTTLCVMQHPELFDGLKLLPLSDGAHARYLNLVARHRELGGAPEKIAKICRDIYISDIVPKILEQMPWQEGKAVAVVEEPAF